ncbi:hypothetical protein J6590_097892 [Homalodisca vitripennis]|nr:hypothetical protein J6590_097892 [Homalodisca vitripennis]
MLRATRAAGTTRPLYCGSIDRLRHAAGEGAPTRVVQERMMAGSLLSLHVVPTFPSHHPQGHANRDIRPCVPGDGAHLAQFGPRGRQLRR